MRRQIILCDTINIHCSTYWTIGRFLCSMYPHIFLDNVKTGSTIIRCYCEDACASKEFDNQTEMKTDDKLCCYESKTEPELFKNESKAIEKWVQQVTNYYPFDATTKPLSFLDQRIASSPPTYTPRQSKPQQSSDNEDQSENSELNQQTIGLQLLIDTLNVIESPENVSDTSNDSMENLTISQDEVVTEYESIFMGCETGFENILMLAEEAVKRIDLRSKNTNNENCNF